MFIIDCLSLASTHYISVSVTPVMTIKNVPRHCQMSSGEQFPIASDLQQRGESWTRWPAVDMETLHALLADGQV